MVCISKSHNPENRSNISPEHLYPVFIESSVRKKHQDALSQFFNISTKLSDEQKSKLPHFKNRFDLETLDELEYHFVGEFCYDRFQDCFKDIHKLTKENKLCSEIKDDKLFIYPNITECIGGCSEYAVNYLHIHPEIKSLVKDKLRNDKYDKYYLGTFTDKKTNTKYDTVSTCDDEWCVYSLVEDNNLSDKTKLEQLYSGSVLLKPKEDNPQSTSTK